MQTLLSTELTQKALKKLSDSNQFIETHYPGDSKSIQPIHTVYGGAQLFNANLVKKMGQRALDTLKTYAPTAHSLGKALGMNAPHSMSEEIYRRVSERLEFQPVQDFRIDFEDGFGHRPNSEEDEQAIRSAKEVAIGMKEKTLPPLIGIRIKAFTEESKHRSIRTLDLFLSTLLSETNGKIPSHFVVTLPKVTNKSQVSTLAGLLSEIEKVANLDQESLKLEIMIETTQSIFRSDGSVALLGLARAAEGRCVGAHFGTYDYTACCDVSAHFQQMDHLACEFAKQHMKVAYAGTGIWLSDGATNILPVGPHRSKQGSALTEAQKLENESVIHRAWQLSYRNIRRSLSQGFYQGWDLHPAQLPVRYAAAYHFFLEALTQTGRRLSNFIQQAAQATLVGEVFDDAASGQGLLNFFLRGYQCGAISKEEVTKTGITMEELDARSFAQIVENRRP